MEKTQDILQAFRHIDPQITQSILRTTNLYFTEQGLVWGTDDSLGSSSRLLRLDNRFDCTGAHTLADIGPLARNIVRCENICLLLTEGLTVQGRVLPEVWAFALDPFTITRVARVPSWSVKAKLSLSTASPYTVDGVFYTLRGWEDMFPGDIRQQMLRWVVTRSA
jgi:hypothetical protein